MTEVDLSIIIVNWNTGTLLRECIASLYATLKTHTFEVIVVDNASTDKSASDLDDWLRLRVIFSHRNMGFAAANNQGFSLSAGRYLLMLNPDTIALEGAIDSLVDYLESHPRIGAVGPRLLTVGGQLQPSCSRFPSLYNASSRAMGLSHLFPRNRFFARGFMTYWHHDSECQVDVICGACLMIRREALVEVGYLDEMFFQYYEETDLCLRFKQSGWSCHFFPFAQVIHLGGRSTVNNLDVRIVAYNQSLLKFFNKHYPKWQSWILRGCIIIEMLWRIAATFILGIPSLRTKSRSEVRSRYMKVINMCLKPRKYIATSSC